MKIVFIIDSLTAGGKERRLVELLKGLSRSPNFECHIVILSEDIHYAEVLALNCTIQKIIRKTRKDLGVFRKFFKLCQIIKPDIIHCWDSMTAIYSIPICKILRIKFINGMVADAPVHLSIFNKTYFRARVSFWFADIVIGNSLAGLAAYKAPTRKSRCIYNGFNFERIKFKGSVDEHAHAALNIHTPLVVGMVATFSALKDYRTFFRAAEIILGKRRDVTFVAIGKETDSIECKRLIPAGLQSHFRLLGKKTNVEFLVNTFDVAVLATFTEGISNSILEYMALSKPVVATDGGGTSELVVHGKTGFLVDQGDAVCLSNNIESLLDRDMLRKRMGLAGCQRVKSMFSIDRMISEYILLCNSLVS